jgi:hypothetical protein
MLVRQVFIDSAELLPGTDWRSTLSSALAKADVILALITPNSESSEWVMAEIGAARAYQQARSDVLLVPILVGTMQLPKLLSDIQAIIVTEPDVHFIAEQVLQAINTYAGVKAAKQVERKEIQERIERTSADYIEEALRSLGAREERFRRTAFGWYSAGFIALISGIAASVVLTKDALVKGAPGSDWPTFAYLALKSVIIIGLLVASSKYSFSLGRSYMTESLKNADRVHAISFGKFYLGAYGEKATWPEIKEAFQYWNIDKDSAFSLSNTKEFDPNFVGAVAEVAKAVSARAGGKQK